MLAIARALKRQSTEKGEKSLENGLFSTASIAPVEKLECDWTSSASGALMRVTWRLSGVASPNAQRPGPQAVGGKLPAKPEEENVDL